MTAGIPVVVRRNFLPAETAAGLLDHALANQAAFRPTDVSRPGAGIVIPAYRTSLGTRDLGPLKSILKTHVRDAIPDLIAALGMSPFEVAGLELQMVAHGDGAFYGRHIDLTTGTDIDSKTVRALSVVYYFHAQPKSFSEGMLRLYSPRRGPGERSVDVQPAHNSLAAFPTWVPHEVMPVTCPSGAFSDSRFSINCWVHTPRRRREPHPDPAARAGA